MQPGDRVMIRTFDSTEHWIYASVVLPWPAGGKEGALCVVDHPGNDSHGNMINRSRSEIRTKEDLLPLLEAARELPNRVVVQGAGNERQRWVAHYQQQIEQLS